MDQYIAFYLGDTLFGVNIAYILEINRKSEYTPVPGGPPYVKGLMNLRGEIVTLFCIKRCMNICVEQCDGRENIILKTSDEVDHVFLEDNRVSGLSKERVAFRADRITGIIDVEAFTSKPPVDEDKYNTKFVSGVVQLKDSLLMILDIPKISCIEEGKINTIYTN